MVFHLPFEFCHLSVAPWVSPFAFCDLSSAVLLLPFEFYRWPAAL